ncbi:hypothetical protein ACWDE9_36880, partial [Streptomyces olivaceoviridis]
TPSMLDELTAAGEVVWAGAGDGHALVLDARAAGLGAAAVALVLRAPFLLVVAAAVVVTAGVRAVGG